MDTTTLKGGCIHFFIMSEIFFSATRFIHYQWKAKHRKGHGIHSPLIYKFVSEVLCKRDISEIEVENRKLYQTLCKDNRTISLQTFGALQTDVVKIVSISQIARKSTTREKYRFLLGRIAHYYKFPITIELGSSLGITSHILSKKSFGTVVSVEGCEPLAQLARINLESLGCNNCTVINQPFEQFLSQIREITHPIFVYLDGNHTYKATVDYFHFFEKNLKPGSIVAIGDIYWSKEMSEAWRDICQNHQSRYTVDIFGLGIVFFHTKAIGQHYVIRF